MGANLIGELVANNGTYFLQNSESEYEGNIDQIIVRGNGIAIVIFITNEEGFLDVTGNYLENGKDQFLPNGLRITPENNDVFTKVKIEANTNVDGGSGVELVLA